MNNGLYDGITRPPSVPEYNPQPNSYTTTLADMEKPIFHANGDPTATYTIASENAVNYPRFAELIFINEGGGGTVTISINSDTLQLAGPGTTGNRTLGAYGWAVAIKIRTNPAIWMISGTGLT